MRAQLEALKNQSFRNFFFGTFISFFGSGLTFLCSTWYVFSVTDKSIMVALVWMVSLLSSPFLHAYSGAIIDRCDRKKLVVWLSAVRFFVVIAVPILVWTGNFKLWHLFFMLFVEGIGFNLSFPTEKALVQEIVSGKGLLVANSLIEISLQSGVFIAAGFGGIIYKYIGLSGVLTIDAITFAVAAVFFNRINNIGITKHSHEEDHFLKSVAEGWKFMFSNRTLLAIGILSSVPSAISLASNVITPAFVLKTLMSDSATYGVVEMAYGIGAFLSGFFAPQFVKIGKERISILLFFTIGALLIAVPLIPRITAALVIYFALGTAITSTRIILSTVLLERSPPHMTGRVMSVTMLSFFFLQLACFGLASASVDIFAVALGYIFLAAIAFGSFALTVRYRKKLSA